MTGLRSTSEPGRRGHKSTRNDGARFIVLELLQQVCHRATPETAMVLQSCDMVTATCLFRPMAEADIPQVYAIDHEAFPAESLFRPYSSYGREMQNSMAHYVVGCVPSPRRDREMHRSWLRRLLKGGPLHPARAIMSRELLVGFAGFWIMLDEAHIIAIAVRKPYQRQGIGEGLLLSAIDMAAKLHTRLVTLEVRESNHGAQEMYRKYGFVVVGKRPRYYSDNQEDAILMSIEDVQGAEFQTQFARHKADVLRKECLARPIALSPDAFEEALD
jgi:ribosomal-protein-alanine N-acetyltransferase